MKVFIRTFLVLVLVLLILAGWKVLPMAGIGAGYIAKNLCSEFFVAHRSDLDSILADIAAVDPTFAFFSSKVDEPSRSASAWLGPGIGRTTAVFRPRLGCTLASGVSEDELLQLSADTLALKSRFDEPARVLQDVQEPLPALEQVLDDTFAAPADNAPPDTRAIVVLHRGELVAERYAPPFDQHAPMIGWSMSKSLTNNLVGLMVKDGQLNLDEPAPVTAWADPSDVRHGITLRHLLQMSSGLEFSEVYKPGSDATRMLFGEPSAGLFAAQSGLTYPPGTHWSYSSGTTNILARIVFEKTGGNLDAMYAFIHQRMLGPLGLTSMVLEPDASGVPVGSSFTYATARDWATVGQFWLQDGAWNGEQILPHGWMEWSARRAPAAPRGEYGAQFWLNAGRDGEQRDWPDLPANLFYASGFNGQFVVVFPDEEIVVVRLGLSTDGNFSLGDLLRGVYQSLVTGRGS